KSQKSLSTSSKCLENASSSNSIFEFLNVATAQTKKEGKFCFLPCVFSNSKKKKTQILSCSCWNVCSSRLNVANTHQRSPSPNSQIFYSKRTSGYFSCKLPIQSFMQPRLLMEGSV